MPDENESSLRALRNQDFSQDLARRGWFHSFRLPDGTFYDGHLSVEELQRRVSLMPIAADLAGKRVLDIGAWDGWFSFEMERRGAQVVAIDCVEMANFRKIHSALGSQVDYRVADVHDLTAADFGRFDVVLFLSVLYHLKHPLLALEKVCALSTDLAIVSSFTIDDYRRPVESLLQDFPRMDFYETDELGGQLDNWFGPNLACLMGLCRAAGFARVELLDIAGQSAVLACHRKWLPAPPSASAPVRLVSALNARSSGINFRSAGSEEHIACWFESDSPELDRHAIRPEVGGYGVPCLHVSRQPGRAWQCNFRLPPGLNPGWHPVTLRVAGDPQSEPRMIAVDIPFHVGDLTITGACDSFSWTPNAIVQGADRAAGVSIWVSGLPDNADCQNVKAFLGDLELRVDAVKTSGKAEPPENLPTTQVNAFLAQPVSECLHTLTVSAGERTSAPFTVVVSANSNAR
jgi:tRNA (mo5U34)-methyltransferase